jgi:hypothetical protein
MKVFEPVFSFDVSKLQMITANMVVDDVRYVYVPNTFVIPAYRIFLRTGTFWYPKYKGKARCRDERREIVFCKTDVSYLFGVGFGAKLNCGLLPKNLSELSKHFFGVKTESLLLAKRLTELPKLLACRLEVLASYKLWTKHCVGGKFWDFFEHPCADKVVASLVWYKKYGLDLPIDRLDVDESLAELGLDYRSATELYKKRSNTKKFVFGDVVLDGTKTNKNNMHDFVVSLGDLYEQKVFGALSTRTRNLTIPQNKEVQVRDCWKVPDGFELVKTFEKLVKLSKDFGWCCYKKAYRTMYLSTDHMFVFCGGDNTLAHYVKGKLVQQRKPRNCRSDTAPDSLVFLKHSK